MGLHFAPEEFALDGDVEVVVGWTAESDGIDGFIGDGAVEDHGDATVGFCDLHAGLCCEVDLAKAVKGCSVAPVSSSRISRR